MAEHKDYFGEKLRLLERAREDAYFRQVDQQLLARMRQEAAAETAPAAQGAALFPRVLAAVDFSPHATEALRYAAGIAERFASSLIVLHVIPRETSAQALAQRLGHRHVPLFSAWSPPPDVAPEVAEEVVVDLREQAYTALQRFVSAALPSRPAELRVVIGQPFERIIETAVREQVALIILGTHGRTGLAHTMMGSVAERVVRLAPCPVLTVKRGTSEAEEKDWLQGIYEKILNA
ncbi:MAG: universal stress protein [Candidatus Tectimicrobiota bacterium]